MAALLSLGWERRMFLDASAACVNVLGTFMQHPVMVMQDEDMATEGAQKDETAPNVEVLTMEKAIVLAQEEEKADDEAVEATPDCAPATDDHLVAAADVAEDAQDTEEVCISCHSNAPFLQHVHLVLHFPLLILLEGPRLNGVLLAGNQE
jgi:hypothetical protein